MKIKPADAKKPLVLMDAVRNLYREANPDTNADGKVSLEEFEAFIQQVDKDRADLIVMAEAMVRPAAIPAPIGFRQQVANHDRDIDDANDRLKKSRQRLEDEREEKERRRLTDEIRALETRLALSSRAREEAQLRAEQAEAATGANGNAFAGAQPANNVPLMVRPDFNQANNNFNAGNTNPGNVGPNFRNVNGGQREAEPVRREFNAPQQPRMEARSEPRMVERAAPSRPEPKEQKKPEPKEEKKPEPKVEKGLNTKK